MENQYATIRLREWGEFLGSRKVGSEIRERVDAFFQTGVSVELDFAGVQMVSHSFADELLGKLIASVGLSAMKGRLRLLHVPQDIAPILRFAIGNRETRDYSDPPF